MTKIEMLTTQKKKYEMGKDRVKSQCVNTKKRVKIVLNYVVLSFSSMNESQRQPDNDNSVYDFSYIHANKIFFGNDGNTQNIENKNLLKT